ncbi:calcium-binding protein [Bosea sp. MMO-172]|uniref:calcium-binding protein n=1 Tax=Bosea sp. MMO-172 TaxID=3127885 RepID=UPI0030172A94
MISIKAAKPTEPQLPDAAQIYRKAQEEPAAKPRWPGVFALAFTAVVLYLKSLFPGQAKTDASAPPAAEDKAQAGEAARKPSVAEGEEQRPDGEKDVDETGALGKEPPGVKAIGTGGPGVAVPGLPDFLNIDSRLIDYDQLPLPRYPSPIFEAGLSFSANNDNGGRGFVFTAVSGGGSEGGGSGGGGGGSSGPGPGDGDGDDDTPEQPRNRAPRVSGPVQLVDIGGCQTLMIASLALLAGATDADADPLSIVGIQASRGQLTATEGGWVFKPQSGWYGAVTLTYWISDGEALVQQTATLRVLEFLDVTGTSGDDILLGSECADQIAGLGGDDVIDARGGNDIVVTGAGDDHIVGGAGNDHINAGEGNDIVFGGAGNDVIDGGAGNDSLHGGDGDDMIYGRDGNDTITGGPGSDIIDAGPGHDEIDAGDGPDLVLAGPGNDSARGGAGPDRLFGQEGCDEIKGDDGDDFLDGGADSDQVSGGKGNDWVVATSDAADDCYDGGEGWDTLDLSATEQGVTVDLKRGKAVGIEIGKDTVIDFEAILGGSGDDCLIVGEKAATLTGGDGNDRFVFAVDDDAARTDDLVHQILDLEAGDRIVIKQYQLRSRDDDDDGDDDQGGDSDGFEQAYGDSGDDRPFRFRIEKIGENERTYVDVYVEESDATDFSVEIYGNHKLYYV